MKISKQNKLMWGFLSFATLWLLAGASWAAGSIHPSVISKISPTALIEPEVKKFQAEAAQLVNAVSSPFACIRAIAIAEYDSTGRLLHLVIDLTDPLLAAINRIFDEQLDSMREMNYSGFEAALGNLLDQSDYQCLKDAGKFTVRYKPSEDKILYEGEAYNSMLDIAKRATWRPLMLSIIIQPKINILEIDTNHPNPIGPIPSGPVDQPAVDEIPAAQAEPQNRPVETEFKPSSPPDDVGLAMDAGGGGCTIQTSSGGFLNWSVVLLFFTPLGFSLRRKK